MSNEIKHHGVPGMKWGVHRSIANYTSQGSDHARKTVKAVGKIQKRKVKRMNLKHMTDKEMRDRINRERLEREYDDMFNPKKVSKGRQRVEDILSVAGPAAATTASALAIALSIQKLRGK